MSRLLAADRIAAAAHLLEHIAVADRRHLNAAAERSNCLVKSDICHHCRHDCVVRQMPRAHHLRRTGNENMIPVDQRPRLIETEAAIRVAVMGDTDVRSAFEHRTAQRVQMQWRTIFMPSKRSEHVLTT